MPLTVNLPPDLEARLRAEAEQVGLPADEYLRILIEPQLIVPPTEHRSAHPHKTMTLEEWNREFDALTASFADIPTPDYSDELLRREHLYEDRGL